MVARSASAPLRLAGHLGWVHRQEARAVGQPRERMGGRRERRRRAEIRSFATKYHKAPAGGVKYGTLDSRAAPPTPAREGRSSIAMSRVVQRGRVPGETVTKGTPFLLSPHSLKLRAARPRSAWVEQEGTRSISFHWCEQVLDVDRSRLRSIPLGPAPLSSTCRAARISSIQ